MIKAKKSLGQNFLIDDEILDKIVNIVSIKDQNILEVGPGTGNLTSKILNKNPKKFYVIEKDNNLAAKLSKKFSNKLVVFNNDILQMDEKNLVNEKVIVFGNLPYNISTEILSKWITNLKEDVWFNNLILMFQKEVANRIIAQFDTSDYGRLSILSNWRLDVKKICDISPEAFLPKPKIDSSLLIFTPKKSFFKLEDPKSLEIVTKVFFNQRRKMIKKPFNQLFNGNIDIQNKLNLNLNSRPQNLNLETYYNLAKEYENLRD